ncbi:MAG: VCBS repeat-containing protein, partial [Bacteroidota bacterium]
MFSALSAQESGIDFTNELILSEDFDVFRYRNYYNGGGVAIGDINNDGLSDIYFTANMGQNKLFLNQGNFKFENITELAGVGGNKVWATGVAMADVNGDGLLDIYVCNSGDVMGGKRENELFINNGDLTFSEQAADYGLINSQFSVKSSF